MNIEEQVRKLARSQYWQAIYHASKECNGVQLFENSSNISGIQMMFLYWLRVYALLYEELNSLEWSNLHEAVIKDDIHCDAFLYWRSRELEKRQREYREEERKNRPTGGRKAPENESVSKIFKGKQK